MPSDPKKSSQAPAGKEEDAKPKPRCPNCGWKNVRISHNKNIFDTFLSAAMSIQRFKCRTCGRYFRHRYRIDE